jgi:hypothetical protein
MHKLSRRTTRLLGCVLAAAFLSACAAVGSAALTGDADTTIQACRHKLTGRLRSLAAGESCRTSEQSISWNKEGPAGPQGPAGPKGDPGTGMTKLNDVDGVPCTRDDGKDGTVDLEIAGDGDVTLLCIVGSSPPPPPPPPGPPPPPPPPPPPGAKLVINEVDYDQVGTDGDGFVEIANTGSAAADLSTIALVFVDGSDGTEYDREALTGTLAAGAYLVVAVDAQNGAPDGLALVNTGTHAVVDALSYEGAIASAVIDGATVSLVEGTALDAAVADSNAVAGSLIRNPDGEDTDDASADWAFTTTLTRGAANVHTTP